MEKYVILDCRAEDCAVYTLEREGFTVIASLRLEGLYDAISAHPDIQIHYAGQNRFICAPEVYEYYKKKLKNCEVINAQEPVGLSYPEDVRLNAAYTGEYLICNVQYTAKQILNIHTDVPVINVKQGYSKCSCCIADKRSLITEDAGIAAAAESVGMEVLRVNAGSIKLRGMNYGFIGGATGLIKNNLLSVYGDINTHKNANEIKEFLRRKNINILSLKNGRVEDIGTIIANI